MTRVVFLTLLLVLAGLAFCGCESGSGWQGRYVSPATQVPLVTLTLQTDGKGLWMADQESTPVRWKIRQGELWLHVRTGGVLIARPLDNDKTLSVSLPGGANVLLKKTPD